MTNQKNKFQLLTPLDTYRSHSRGIDIVIGSSRRKTAARRKITIRKLRELCRSYSKVVEIYFSTRTEFYTMPGKQAYLSKNGCFGLLMFQLICVLGYWIEIQFIAIDVSNFGGVILKQHCASGALSFRWFKNSVSQITQKVVYPCFRKNKWSKWCLKSFQIKEFFTGSWRSSPFVRNQLFASAVFFIYKAHFNAFSFNIRLNW